MVRGLSKKFLDKMREKLRLSHRSGYETHWRFTAFGRGYRGELFQSLQTEVIELGIALDKLRKRTGTIGDVYSEAADVANFAMMIADAHDPKNQ